MLSIYTGIDLCSNALNSIHINNIIWFAEISVQISVQISIDFVFYMMRSVEDCLYLIHRCCCQTETHKQTKKTSHKIQYMSQTIEHLNSFTYFLIYLILWCVILMFSAHIKTMKSLILKWQKFKSEVNGIVKNPLF